MSDPPFIFAELWVVGLAVGRSLERLLRAGSVNQGELVHGKSDGGGEIEKGKRKRAGEHSHLSLMFVP